MQLRFAVATGALLVLIALALVAAYRGRGPHSWGALAVFSGGGIVLGYGLLARLLCSVGSVPCRTSRSGDAIVAGAGIALAALAYLGRNAARRR